MRSANRARSPSLVRAQQQLLDGKNAGECSWARRTGKPCRTWKCPSCRVGNAQALREDVLRGLAQAAEQNIRARFFTLTDGSDRPMHLKDFHAAFKRFRRGLGWTDYISALGCDPDTGHLHSHVVALGGPYARQKALSERAEGARLGPVLDVRAIGPSQRDRAAVAGYMAQNALHYAVVHENTGVRIQPVSRSR